MGPKDLEELEEAFNKSPDGYDSPMPNESHPALSRIADTVRGYGRRTVTVVIPISNHRLANREMASPDQTIPTKKVYFIRRQMCAPAPFVSDHEINEAMYCWPVWRDDLGRAITGEARLVWKY